MATADEYALQEEQQARAETFDDLSMYEVTMQIWSGLRYIKFKTCFEAFDTNGASRKAKDAHSNAVVVDCKLKS